MDSKTSIRFLAVLLYFAVVGAAARVEDSLAVKCSKEYEKVTQCQPFITEKVASPSKDCCDSVTSLKETNPACLCYIIQQVHNGANAAVKSMGMSQTHLLQLSSACKLANASISQCPGFTARSTTGNGLHQFVPSCAAPNFPPCSALAPPPQVPTYRPVLDTFVKNKSIFILAGQSNMAGRGGIIGGSCWDARTPPQCQRDPRILRLSCKCEWEEAVEPIHQDIDVTRPCGVGPGMPFAHSLLDRDSSLGVIGLVPCAIGGTTISKWERDSDNFNQLVARARKALQDGGQLRAMLWYQGEEDANENENAIHYKDRLERFLTDVRMNLSLPMLPVIQVALASAQAHGRGNFTHLIREAQLKIKLPNVVTVDAWGLEIQPTDYIKAHLSTPAQVKLGQMLADAFVKNFL